MLSVAPGFSPLHSFLGGLMLASGVHALLRELGIVLGISGFLHTNVRNMLITIDPSTSTSTSVRDPQRIHHRISPSDDDETQSDQANGFTSRLFVHGLLAGGALLAAARVPLEVGLGTAIFDAPDLGFHIGKGLSEGIFSIQAAKRFVPVAIWGLLVGFGTKLGSGCTSGHFLCGLSRFSPRSLAATATFFSVAVLTNTYANPAHPLSRKAAVLAAPQSPSLWALVLLQVPALFYTWIIPAVVERRSKRKGISEEESKSLHEQAAKSSSFLIGLYFALGLALTGMTRPSKVLGFLNLAPSRVNAGLWDPSLAFVALGGISASCISWFFSIKPRIEQSKKEPLQADNRPLYWRASPRWRVPSRTDIDWRLLFGAVLFGVGWGMTGLCPGPSLVGFGASTLPAPQDKDALVVLANRGTFVGAVGAGGLLASLI